MKKQICFYGILLLMFSSCYEMDIDTDGLGISVEFEGDSEWYVLSNGETLDFSLKVEPDDYSNVKVKSVECFIGNKKFFTEQNNSLLSLMNCNISYPVNNLLVGEHLLDVWIFHETKGVDGIYRIRSTVYIEE